MHDESAIAMKSISMMDDFAADCYPAKSYSSEEVKGLDLSEEEKQSIVKILSVSSEYMHRAYLGKDDRGRHYFETWTV